MISWLCFEWRTDNLPDFDSLVAPLVIRPAEKSDEEGVAKVLKSAFAVDSGWGDVNRAVEALLTAATERVFSDANPHCLVVLHGNRIIGASLIDTDSGAENHLLSGPCILHEYRNRGLASALLAASLGYLAKTDIKTARGFTRANSITARFIYSKFGGTSRPFDGDPLKMEAA